jgi:hypothetical protein
MFKLITILTLVLGFLPLTAEAKSNHVKHKLAAKSEVWCGATSSSDKYRFPYLASIQLVSLKHGKKSEVVTIFKKNRVVFRELVQKLVSDTGLTYRSSDDEFALKFTPHAEKDSLAGFRAVIHDEDGVKLIENGEFLCHKS